MFVITNIIIDFRVSSFNNDGVYYIRPFVYKNNSTCCCKFYRMRG